MMTRHCHNCGEPWTINGSPGRGETCMKCRADLRVCLNCTSYDPRAAEQCRERRADLVFDKHLGNFCEYFEFMGPGHHRGSAVLSKMSADYMVDPCGR